MFDTDLTLTIRRLGSEDEPALAQLAQRDSSPLPLGTVIGALSPAGELLAAISLETGELIADPFLPSEHAAAIVRVRADQMRGDGAPKRRLLAPRARSRAAPPSSPPGAGGRLLALTGPRRD